MAGHVAHMEETKYRIFSHITKTEETQLLEPYTDGRITQLFKYILYELGVRIHNIFFLFWAVKWQALVNAVMNM